MVVLLWYQRFAWPLTLVGGVLSYLALLIVMLATRDLALFPALLLVGALTVPLAVLLFALTGRHGTLAPPAVVVVTVLVGGVVSITAAALLEGIARAVLGAASILLVGVIEESTKLLVPLVVLALGYRATRTAGPVIGVAAGTGFAVLETMGYGFAALLERGGGIGAVDATLLLRGVLAPAGHVAWTGVVCAALWFLRAGHRPGWGVVAALGAYLGAIVLHTAWDTVSSETVHVIIGLVSVGGLLTVTARAHRQQRHAAAEALAPSPPALASEDPRPHTPETGIGRGT